MSSLLAHIKIVDGQEKKFEEFKQNLEKEVAERHVHFLLGGKQEDNGLLSITEGHETLFYNPVSCKVVYGISKSIERPDFTEVEGGEVLPDGTVEVETIHIGDPIGGNERKAIPVNGYISERIYSGGGEIGRAHV